jgi:hypothetical protein
MLALNNGNIIELLMGAIDLLPLIKLLRFFGKWNVIFKRVFLWLAYLGLHR